MYPRNSRLVTLTSALMAWGVVAVAVRMLLEVAACTSTDCSEVSSRLSSATPKLKVDWFSVSAHSLYEIEWPKLSNRDAEFTLVSTPRASANSAFYFDRIFVKEYRQHFLGDFARVEFWSGIPTLSRFPWIWFTSAQTQQSSVQFSYMYSLFINLPHAWSRSQ